MQKLLMKNLKVRSLVWILGLPCHVFEYASNKNLIKVIEVSRRCSLIIYIVLFQYYR